MIQLKGAQQLPFLFGACDANDESDTWPFLLHFIQSAYRVPSFILYF